jgi:hypothetical protein
MQYNPEFVGGTQRIRANAADAQVRPWQAAIQPGAYFTSLAEDELPVFGTARTYIFRHSAGASPGIPHEATVSP